MAINSSVNSKTSIATTYDQSKISGTRIDPGPYIGKVKANVDPARLGRFMVYIPELGGPEGSTDENSEHYWRIVHYASPFFGTTNLPESNKGATDQNARHSYGMWATAPDVGNLVLVVFVNGDPNKGYYLGTIPTAANHHMVPGNAGSDNWKDDQGYGALGRPPVVEFNDNIPDNINVPEFMGIKKPVHIEQAKIFAEQGTLNDKQRGVMTSSSQRETPSAVFGISTPGRPAEGIDYADETIIGRDGGHTFVMDDGDENGDNRIVRMRTHGGHQILMNDTEDILYISNAKGTVWIEFTAAGDIDVYAQNDINIRNKGSVNWHVEKDFNLHVNGKTKIFTKESIDIQSKSLATRTIDDTTIWALNGGLMMRGHNFALDTPTTGSINCKSDLKIVGSTIGLNSGGSPLVQQPKPFSPSTYPETAKTGLTWDVQGNVKSISAVPVPTHEPYQDHKKTITKKNVAAGQTTVDNTSNSGSPVPGSASKTPKKYTPTKHSVPKASLEDIKKQPMMGPIGNISAEKVQAAKAEIAAHESGGRYDIVGGDNNHFLGKYQVGSDVLIDQGLMKPKDQWAPGGQDNPQNWNNGLSKDEFLHNPDLQEKVMQKNMESNYKVLSSGSNAVITPGTSPDDAAGYLASSHLLGAGGVKKALSTGVDGHDAFGTSGGSYFTAVKATTSKVT